jgi:hypothetical protein
LCGNNQSLPHGPARLPDISAVACPTRFSTGTSDGTVSEQPGEVALSVHGRAWHQQRPAGIVGDCLHLVAITSTTYFCSTDPLVGLVVPYFFYFNVPGVHTGRSGIDVAVHFRYRSLTLFTHSPPYTSIFVDAMTDNSRLSRNL